MNQIRVMFFGTPVFACSILQALIDEKYNIVGVVSQPDRPVGRKHTIEKTPVHALADEHQIPVLQPEKLKDGMDEVLSYEPDLIVTCAYGQFIPEAILKYPKYGCVNVHPSLLPKYRGGAPVHYAVLNGDERTGVCLMEMIKKMDAGKVYARRFVDIGEDMTTEELNLVLEKESVKLIREELPKYLAGELPGEEQDEAGMTVAHNISREQEKVSFQDEEVSLLYNHMRALIDWPISYGVADGKRIKFYKVRKRIESHSHAAGEIVGFEDHAMKIAAKGGYILVYELQPEGKNRMNADAYANGAGRSMIGKVFE